IVQESNSKQVIEGLTKHRVANEDSGYIGKANAKLLRGATAAIRARRTTYTMKKVNGKNGQAERFDVTNLASDGPLKPVEDSIEIAEDPKYKLSGAKVQAITQKLAYRAIRDQKDEKITQRPRTQNNLAKISQGAEIAFGRRVPDKSIWKGLRKNTITREARQFMWRTMHDGYMVGTHWMRSNMSDELKARATCKVCNEIDSMDHILFECKAPERELIWKLLKRTWTQTKRRWFEPGWGTIFGAPSAVLKSPKGQRMREAEDLWTILATESLHLIWKLRCERVIQNDGEPFTRTEIRNRWYATIEGRLDMERMVVAALPRTKKSRGKKIEQFEETWLPIIENTHKLPYDWATNCGVLVGIKRGR
ncbi:hypothetical protein LXA43DRAFT_888323, partial [Ganoderma leucocontextum]